MVASLSIPVANVAQLMGLGLTTIEVWNSKDEGDTYQEVTASAQTPATLVSAPAATTFRMGGRQLSVSVDNGPTTSILFSVVIDYWTPTQVVERINDVVPGLASLTEDGLCVVLTSPTTGRGSSLRIVYNDAHDLWWQAGLYALGQAGRIQLVPGQVLYSYADVHGVPGFDRYKWRFSANGLEPITHFSMRVFGLAAPVDASLISVGTALFLALDGTPKKAQVVVATDELPKTIGSYVVSSDGPQTFEADDAGLIQIPLIRGAKLRVGIEGTAMVRSIVVPSTPTFDILAALSSAPDMFPVQTTPPLLTRRTL